MLFGLSPELLPSHIWTSDDSVAFNIGSLPIKWYGIFMTIGFIIAIALAVTKLAAWYKIKTDPFFYFCLIGIPVSIFGSRIWSCIIGDAHWDKFFDFQTGGLAIQGGVALTVIAALIFFPLVLRTNKMKIRDIKTDPSDPQVRQVSMWVYFDAIVPCILAGQILGRWGNYFNQEVYGQVISASDVGYMTWLRDHLPYMYVSGLDAYVQPLFLYESCANIVGLIFIYVAMEFIPGVKAGTIGATYFLWYGVLRAIMEPFRYGTYTFPSTYVIDGLWIAIALAIIILNQINVIPKTRKYSCMLIMWDKTFAQLHRIDYASRVKRLEKKNEELMKNNIQDNQIEAKNVHDKLVKTSEHYNRLVSKHLLRKKDYVRQGNRILYYNGR